MDETAADVPIGASEAPHMADDTMRDGAAGVGDPMAPQFMADAELGRGVASAGASPFNADNLGMTFHQEGADPVVGGMGEDPMSASMSGAAAMDPGDEGMPMNVDAQDFGASSGGANFQVPESDVNGVRHSGEGDPEGMNSSFSETGATPFNVCGTAAQYEAAHGDPSASTFADSSTAGESAQADVPMGASEQYPNGAVPSFNADATSAAASGEGVDAGSDSDMDGVTGANEEACDGAAPNASQAARNAATRLVVKGLPREVQGPELADFLSGAVLAGAGQTSAVRTAGAAPCTECGVYVPAGSSTAEAVVAFRTQIGACVALRLNGLECRGASLTLCRPEDYVAPPEGDPALNLDLERVTLADLIGIDFTEQVGGEDGADGRTPGGETTGEQQGSTQDGPQAAEDRPPGDNSAKQVPGDSEKEPGNHYDALGISHKATNAEIKKAYYAKCRILHPDKNKTDPQATAKFQRIAEAYQVLTIPIKRAQYDATLVMQSACENLGVQADPRARTFVERHSSVPGRMVEAMQIEARHVQLLLGKSGFQLQAVKQQSGSDILLLQGQLSVYAQLLIAGPSASIQRAKALITACIAEISGVAAPRDGVVLLVPQQLLPRMPQVAAHFQAIFLQTGVAVRFATADRIVVQGGLRVPQAVVQIQWQLEWRGQILMPTGQTLDPWSYAHYCEAAGIAAAPLARPGEAYQYLLPPADPDAVTVKKLLSFALGITDEAAKNESVVDLATKALKIHGTGRPITAALVRAATSVAVHAEHASLSPQAGAPLLIALHHILPMAVSFIAARFANAPLFKTLTAIGNCLNDPREGLTLRARGATAIREAVPEDGNWHAWDTMLSSDTPIDAFWKDLRNFINDRKSALGVMTPPTEWLSVPAVMSSILRVCIAAPVDVNPDLGVRRPKAATQSSSKLQAQAQRVWGQSHGRAGDQRSGSAATSNSTSVGPPMADETKGDDADQLTLVEHGEEIVFSLQGSDSQAFVPIASVAAEAVNRNIAQADKMTPEWFESHKSSFESTKAEEGDDLQVKLVTSAHQRASARVFERQAEGARWKELRVAEEVLPKLTADIPRALRSPELAALLCVVSRGQHRVPDEISALLLKRMCRRGDVTPKELVQESAPFPPALIMRAIVAIEKQRRERWDKESLDMVLQAAALDMHAVEDRPRAALPTAAAALWAAARRPFDERLNASRCLLVPSAALRLQVELAENCALSPDGSSFRPFAQMCAWLAHLVVTAQLPNEVRSDVLQAFKKLASSCEELGKAPESSPCDPEGLCRLAMAVALVVREEKSDFGTEALDGLANVCVQRALDQPVDWLPQQLAVLASAFAAAEVAHEGLFRKIGLAAERHTTSGNEWSTEQLLKLLHSAWQLGQLGALEKLLKGMDKGLVKYIKEATPRDLPLMFAAIALVKNNSLLEDLARAHRDKLHGAPFLGLIGILKSWPQDKGSTTMASFKAAVVRECIILASRKAPTDAEMQLLVTAAADDAKDAKAIQRFNELGRSPSLINSLPTVDAPWPELKKGISTILAPFAAAKAEVPRLEAACAVRMLAAIEKSSADGRDFAAAVLVLPDSAFVGMPAFIEAVADKLMKGRLPRAGSATDTNPVRQLCEKLVHCASKTSRSSRSNDSDLDLWMDRVDRFLADETRGPANEKRLDWLELQVAKRMSTSMSSIKEMLGSSWLQVLLMRSRRAVWFGGKTVVLEAPRPRFAVKKLAEASAAILSAAVRAEAEGLEAEQKGAVEPSTARIPPGLARAGMGATVKEEGVWQRGSTLPGARGVASGSNLGYGVGARGVATPSTAAGLDKDKPPARLPPGALVVTGGYDKELAQTLAGTFMPCSTNHHRAVYRRVDPQGESKVLLYYWDSRDGEEQQGWWFGPEVGGEEVWAHNLGLATSALPPQRGWRVLHSGQIDNALTVTKVEGSRAGTLAQPSQQLSHLQSARPGFAGARPPPPPPYPGMTRPPGALGSPRPPTRARTAMAATPSTASSATATPSGTKRPRPDSAHAEELRAWLSGLDDGAGAMLQYFDVLAAEFDADLVQIAAVKVEGGEKQGILGVVDPSFWDTVKVEKTGHRMLFARGIAKL